jgi:hypothetical protein
VSIFVSNVSAGTPVTVNLVDVKGQSFTLAAENSLDIGISDFLQVTFRLPENIAPGPCNISVSVGGVLSNTASDFFSGRDPVLENILHR